MHGRDLLRHFKDAPWSSPGEVDQFLSEATSVDASDVMKLLEVLGSKPVLSDPSGFRLRAAALVKLIEATPDPGLFTPLARALKTAEGPLRMVIASLLPKVNNVAAHGELASVLKVADPAIRKVASAVLAQLASKTVIEMLSGYVRDASFPGRMEASDVLTHVLGHRAIGALSDVLKVGAPIEKNHALKLLADPRVAIKDPPSALRALQPVLEDTDVRLVIPAIQIAAQLVSEDEWHQVLAPFIESKQVAIARAALESLRRFPTPRSVRVLDRTLRVGNAQLKLAVIEAAEAMGDEIALPLLVDALAHKNIAVRTRAGAAITALSASNKIDVGRTVLWLLRNRDPSVRRMAVDIAGRVKDPNGELWPQLLEFLRDEDWWVRERVTDALVEMAGRDLTRLVVGYVSDPSDVVRRYAVGVLGRIGDPAALGALVRSAREDVDWWVRESAIEAIALLKDERAVPYLVDMMSREPQLRRACLGALGVLRSRGAAAHVAALLEVETDPDAQIAVLECLEKIGGAPQAPLVEPLASEIDHRVRTKAIELLTSWELSTAARDGLGPNAGLLDQLLVAAVRAEADDLILEANRAPCIKLRGKVRKLAETTVPAGDLKAMLYANLTGVQIQALESLKDVDMSYEVKGTRQRFRVNVFQQMTGIAAVFRVVNDEIPDLRKLSLPDVALRLSELRNGLVLVGGPSSSGKSTTLAALIDDINRRATKHIITLEDPIEVIHKEKKAHVTQREVGTHSRSFATALRATLRQDPDVVLVGEMRDLATIGMAVTAAETGHLVFGTLHTVSADTSIDRLINAFPVGQQPQVRAMVASSLRAVLCQYLIPRVDGRGRVLAVEVLLNNEAIANLIRKGKTFQIPSIIATSREAGMQSMDSELQRLLASGIISADEAYAKAANKKDFEAPLKSESAAKVAPPRPPAAPITPPPKAVTAVAGVRIAGGQPIAGAPVMVAPAVGKPIDPSGKGR